MAAGRTVQPPSAPADPPRRSEAPALGRRLTSLTVACLVLGALVATSASATPSARGPSGPDGPAGVTTGIAVFDRTTGRYTEQLNAETQFRSASVVKLLLALDVLWDLGPDHQVPAADRTRLEAMLRGSDDGVASYYWTQRGGSRIIERTATRLGLTGTAPPPAAYPGHWGYTALTASDTVRIYRYLLDQAPAAVREVVMGNLRRSTRCANDGYDQRFGIPSASVGPWAVKQGWSGFTSGGPTADAGTPAATSAAAPASRRTRGATEAAPPRHPTTAASTATVDLARPALHSTGTVGADDRAIVAVLTLHPVGTPYGSAYTHLTHLVASLDVPGAQRPSGTWLGTLGSGVRVRADATTDSAVITTLPAGVEVLVDCQKRGRPISDGPRSSDWWAHLPQYGGYMTNVYVDTSGERIPGVPVC
ncbi:hypothetical protein ACIRPX_18435 [Streptomyces sp. NPDC101225]|uniref:hypothetical protein n=1 Tax=Streptomyces sp. NPDC101225 TaxID=3366135 RepID=UPI0037F511D6